MSSNDQTLRSSELSQLVLGGSSELPTTAAAQASNPLLFKQAKGTSSASTIAANANALQDVSEMDAAQASQLLKHKHRGKKQQEGIGGKGVGAAGGGAMRYRRQVRRNYHDIIDSEMKERVDSHDHGRDHDQHHRRGEESGEEQEDNDDNTFNIRKTKAGHGKQSKAAAGAQAILDKVVKGRTSNANADTSSSEDDDDDRGRGRGRGRNRRRRGRTSSSASSSSSSSDDDDSSVERRRRVREMRARSRRINGSDSDSSSSSDDDNEADQRRSRMRAKMMKKRKEQIVNMPPTKEQSRGRTDKIKGGDESETSSSDDESYDRNSIRVLARGKERDMNILSRAVDKTDEVDSGREAKPRPNRRSTSSSSSSSSTDDNSSSDSSSSEESEEEELVPLTSIAKPMFVPKHRRGKELEEKERLSILADREEKDNSRTDRRIKHSRALVAEIVAMEANQKNMNMNGMDEEEGGDEFANGSSTLVPPNDSDDVGITCTGAGDEGKEFERKAWEVRELLRLLRDFEEIKFKEQEIEERERRRNMTDQERYEEDVKAGKYRKPGEQRQNGSGSAAMAQNQRYFHRGAFYMDEDTLQDKDDIRHRAAEYAQAATGDVIFDKSKMPKIMQQSKQFGLAGNTRYKGLAKEDTSARDSNYLPIYRGKKRSRDGDQRWNDGRR